MVEYGKIAIKIGQKKYENATDDLIDLINYAETKSDKDTTYKSLELLNLICDKNPSVVSKIIREIEPFINYSDEWIRLVTLEILYKISIYRPNDLLDLLDPIKERLWDKDSFVRSLSVKILGTLINSTHLDLSEIGSDFITKLNDVEWRVKLLTSKRIVKILTENPSKIKKTDALIKSVVNNFREENEEIREFAGKIFKLLGFSSIIPKEEFFELIQNLLKDNDWRVRETIIDIIGEICNIYSSEIKDLIPQLISLLGDHSYVIQSKTINSLIKIAKIHFDELFSNLIAKLNTDNNELKNNVEETLFYLGQDNIESVSTSFFEELNNPLLKIRTTISRVLTNLYDENENDIENEILKLFNKFESKLWRKRKNLVNLLTDIALILKSEKIYVLIGSELKKKLLKEKDVEVKEEIEINLLQLKDAYENLDTEIDKVQQDVEFFNYNFLRFTNYPSEFRETISSHIRNLQFDKAEIELNESFKDFLKQLNDFDNEIKSFNVKHLVVDILEEWEDIKIQLIEEISIIKEYEFKKLEKKKDNYKLKLNDKIRNIEDRIKILSIEFDLIKDFDKKINNLLKTHKDLSSFHSSDLKEKFNQITAVRSKLFKFESEIGQMILENLEFEDLFNDLITQWTDVKLDVQKELYNINENLLAFKDIVINLDKEDIKQEMPVSVTNIKSKFSNVFLNSLIASQLIEHQIQNITSQAIEKINEFYSEFEDLHIKVQTLLKSSDFEKIINIENLTSERIKFFFQDVDYELNHLIFENKQFKYQEPVISQFRPYLENWSNSKSILEKKLKNFNRTTQDRLFIGRLNKFLEIMNPISIELIATKFNMDNKILKSKIFELIRNNKIQGKIVENKLYSSKKQIYSSDENNLLLFKNIKLLGNKVFFNFKITNPTNYTLKDVIIRFTHPKYLSFLKENPNPNFFSIEEFPPGSVKKFKYILRIDRDNNEFNQAMDAHEIKLDIYFRDSLKNLKKITRRLDLLFS